jgi:hypothetical protein
VPDLRWDDVKDWFDPVVNGTLPDVYVRDTARVDWQAVVDLVRSRGWAYEYREDSRVRRMPSVDVMFARASVVHVVLTVWPAPGTVANFWPRDPAEIWFDVDIREIQGQDRLDLFCAFLRAIGRRLGKPVVMCPEGFDVEPDLGY